MKIWALIVPLLLTGNASANSLGWDHASFSEFRDGCITGILNGVKTDFMSIAAENGRPDIIFPEGNFYLPSLNFVHA